MAATAPLRRHAASMHAHVRTRGCAPTHTRAAAGRIDGGDGAASAANVPAVPPRIVVF